MTRVLVIEDDADLAALARVALTDCDVQIASDGIEGLDVLLRGRDQLPDLVLLDIQMPNLDGWAVLEQIRNVPRLAALPVVVCSVRGSDADRAHAAERGAAGFLPKPYTPDQLRTIVSELATSKALSRPGPA